MTAIRFDAPTKGIVMSTRPPILPDDDDVRVMEVLAAVSVAVFLTFAFMAPIAGWNVVAADVFAIVLPLCIAFRLVTWFNRDAPNDFSWFPTVWGHWMSLAGVLSMFGFGMIILAISTFAGVLYFAVGALLGLFTFRAAIPWVSIRRRLTATRSFFAARRR